MRIYLTLTLGLVSTLANAQWVATSLHTEGDLFSQGYAVGADKQGGVSRPSGVAAQGKIWSGTPASGARVHPDDNVVSEVYGISGSNSVGYNRSGPFQRLQATMWDTNTLAATNLHPSGQFGSIAFGVSGNQQVGAIYSGGSGDLSSSNAVIWNGSSSYINLDQGDGSAALATDGTTQVGWVNAGGGPLAAAWSGTSGSFQQLESGGAPAQANAVQGDQVGGWIISGPGNVAAIWSLSNPGTYDLLEFSNISEVRGVASGYQAGFVEVAGGNRATLWTGVGSSRINLHSFLPFYYEQSEANAIYVSGSTINVVGTAYNSLTQRAEAMYWTNSPVPEPATMITLGAALAGLAVRRRRRS